MKPSIPRYLRQIGYETDREIGEGHCGISIGNDHVHSALYLYADPNKPIDIMKHQHPIFDPKGYVTLHCKTTCNPDGHVKTNAPANITFHHYLHDGGWKFLRVVFNYDLTRYGSGPVTGHGYKCESFSEMPTEEQFNAVERPETTFEKLTNASKEIHLPILRITHLALRHLLKVYLYNVEQKIIKVTTEAATAINFQQQTRLHLIDLIKKTKRKLP